MHPFSVPGSPRSQKRIACLLSLAALGWASTLVGCGGGSSGGTGTGGRIDAGNGARDGGTGGRGTGGSGVGGTVGIGGMGTGGMGTGGMDTDASDASDALNVCADAGPDAGGPGDSDFDGVPDCQDGCPFDGNKRTPGMCGCGFEETDADNDGFPDCVDACPKDPALHTAGICGCGIPVNTPLCLVHRYSFNDTTATIADSITIAGGISPANGTAMGGAIPAAGRIVLAGGAGAQIGPQFVSLPAGIVSKVGINATFEAWVTWNPVAGTSNGPWQRVFDFGSSNVSDGGAGNGVTYLFMSPANGANQRARTAITLGGGGGAEDLTDATGTLPSGRQVHIAVVVDGTNRQMTLYIDGTTSVSMVTLRASGILSQLDDVNNWLGRSQYINDQLFAGSISEFRIYSRALSQTEVVASFAAGPDGTVPPPPFDGGTGDTASTPDGGAGDIPADSGGSGDTGGDVPVGG